MTELSICLAIGLAGGVLGGLLGIGGSIIMIPGMWLLFGNKYGADSQHLFQASAMIINLVVALGAVIRHLRAGAVRIDAMKGMVPAALVAIGIGVFASNQFPGGHVLEKLFALFLLYVIVQNMQRILQDLRVLEVPKWRLERWAEDDPTSHKGERVTFGRGVFIGTVMGGLAGLLGIGGGGIAVPLQQVVFRMRLKQCIGTSTAVICITAGPGALMKNATLADHGFSFVADALPITLALIPGAIVGASIGSMLTHRLPTFWVRVVFVIMIALAALKMAGIID